MSDSDILSASSPVTVTHKAAVQVLTTAWMIRPEGADVDDIADLLGLYLERAAYEEIAQGLAEVACVPHDQMRDQLRTAAQQHLARHSPPAGDQPAQEPTTPAAEAERQQTPTRELLHAALVIAQSPGTRRWLLDNDPMAIQQLDTALAAVKHTTTTIRGRQYAVVLTPHC